MNKNKKQIVTASIIFITTLLSGFAITALSFNLFDVLTQNQMRVLFTADVLILFAIGSAAWFCFEAKKSKAKKKKELELRHNKRIEQRYTEMREIDAILAKNKFAA